MDLNLKGKRAFVCGSTQGIGKAIAIELAHLGAELVLIARDEEKLKGVISELSTKETANHEYIVADFDHPDNLRNELGSFLKTSRSGEILINNSGGPAGGKAIDAELKEFKIAFNRHLICNQIMSQALVPNMKEASYGRIVNIISTSVKMPIQGLGVSNTIRGAVANWSKTLANELGEFGITVNNILPGATDTQRLRSIIEAKATKSGNSKEEVISAMKNEIPARRFASSEEVAAAAVFLASPSSAYINGVNLPVDGGRLGCL